MLQQLPLGRIEQIIFQLRSLYNQYGYSQYKMGKFEEYDLYARNKDFLISDSVITFTDRNGKLMALKPDVTLSIVKNTPDTDYVQKLYYNENVYRVDNHSFRELMQVGLECLGTIDDYCICEVLTLAAKSLACISDNWVLNISHLGLVSALLDDLGIGDKTAIFSLIREKNIHELISTCRAMSIAEENIAVLQQLVTTTGTPEQVLPKITALLDGRIAPAPLLQLQRITQVLGDQIRIDFSVVDDIHYYNGIAFKGFVAGLPASVLSGGQYDKLMQKMHRKNGAIGFAVYMDILDRLDTPAREYDVDIVLLYDEAADLNALQAQAAALSQSGSILVQQSLPENIRYKKLMKLNGSEVEILENNA